MVCDFDCYDWIKTIQSFLPVNRLQTNPPRLHQKSVPSTNLPRQNPRTPPRRQEREASNLPMKRLAGCSAKNMISFVRYQTINHIHILSFWYSIWQMHTTRRIVTHIFMKAFSLFMINRLAKINTKQIYWDFFFLYKQKSAFSQLNTCVCTQKISPI